ncbi:uncharacterized protein A4U43_UnF2940 [Asparagus officinalis]|uniref:ABC transmembrane type-1 domain-containing protein n=1 Tax=Asparagus officinalis TaxID=4686 RepID=A0A1R3L748_ASPOF|nr:uncharacterized protein A4U43_UnF2940 [Asparagus officinalis]
MSNDESKSNVENLDRPEMQRFHLCSPPRSPSSPDPDLVVIELGEKQEEQEEAGAGHRSGGEGSGAEKRAPAAGKAEAAAEAVKFAELFRFADGVDLVLMGIGTVGAVVHGCALPVFLRFFADLVDSFGSNADDPDTMCREVVKYAFYFLVVGAAIWASSWAEISCWMWTGERQTTKMRIRYLQSVLNQDVCYFDTEVRTSDVVYAVNADAVIVQDAVVGGNAIDRCELFFWLPAGEFYPLHGNIRVGLRRWIHGSVTARSRHTLRATAMAKLSSKSQDALSQASNTAEQALAQIRTVQSFVGESRALQAYSSSLRIAQRIGYRIGFGESAGLEGGPTSPSSDLPSVRFFLCVRRGLLRTATTTQRCRHQPQCSPSEDNVIPRIQSRAARVEIVPNNLFNLTRASALGPVCLRVMAAFAKARVAAAQKYTRRVDHVW